MSKKRFNKTILQASIITIVSITLFSITHYNFLLFHTLSEVFSIVIAFQIFTITWNSKKYFDNNYFIFIGISYLFTGVIDLFHTITYTDINIIRGYDANLPMQLWIIGRYFESLSFIFAPLFIRRKINMSILFLIILTISIILLVLAFNRILPPCYIEGIGLTFFKKLNEYIIGAILIASIFILLYNKKFFDEKILNMLIIALICKIFSELSSAIEMDIHNFSNTAGHFFKIISYYLFYLAIVQTGIVKPHQLIFKELKDNQEKLSAIALTDELTGLYNRRACYEYMRKMMALTIREKSSLSICLIDLDNLKIVNDSYGHSQGDRLLKIFGSIFKKYLRESDYICRIGGDEFLLIFTNCTQEDAKNYIHRIKEGIELLNKSNRKIKMDFSYGLSEFNYKSKRISVEKLIKLADKNMYKDKSLKKKVA